MIRTGPSPTRLVYDRTRNSTGAPIGELVDGEDGEQLLVGFNGRILRGVDADGQEIDPDRLLADYGAYGYRVEPEEERRVERERRLSVVEATVYPETEFDETGEFDE